MKKLFALLFVLLTVTVACAAQTSQRRLDVMPRPVVSGPVALPPAAEGEPYTFQFTANKCPAPCTFRAEDLPSWLTLSTAGRLEGTPPVCEPVAGEEVCSYAFKVFATNKHGLESVAANIGIDVPGEKTTVEVALTWEPSPSTGIAGYWAKRSQTTGGPYVRISSQLTPCCEYVDGPFSKQTEEQRLYYTVTAQDNQGRESVPSNEAVAVIPQVAVA